MTRTSSLYIDSNIFIYAVEGMADSAAPARKLIAWLREHHGRAVTSEITLAEVLAPPRREGALPFDTKQRAYLDLLLWSGAFDLVPVNQAILIETAYLRLTTKLKLPDAIHLVTALRSNCRFLVCEDNDFRDLPAGIERVRPIAHHIDSLLRTIA